MYRFLLGVLWLAVAVPVQASSTLTTVKKRGYVRCGVNTGLPGFFRTE